MCVCVCVCVNEGVCVRGRAPARACVFVCGSLHCLNKTVASLNLNLI